MSRVPHPQISKREMSSEASVLRGALDRVITRMASMAQADDEYPSLEVMRCELTTLLANCPPDDDAGGADAQEIISARAHLAKTESELNKAEAARKHLEERLEGLLPRAESEEGDDVALEKVQELYGRLQVQSSIVDKLSDTHREAIQRLQDALE